MFSVKARLQENYPDIPERVVTIALESVDFDVDRASQILNIMVQEEEKKQTSEPASIRETYVTNVVRFNLSFTSLYIQKT
jgi:hypothetical protein